MRILNLLFVCLSVALAACSTPMIAAIPADIWLDSAFNYQPGLVTVDEKSLYQLDEALLARLRDKSLQDSGVDARVNFLVTSILGPNGGAFSYLGGQSAVAQHTWRTHRGDCLSLTVLAFAMATELKLQATMQEVPVPVNIDRRGGIDFEVGHVNLVVAARQVAGGLGSDRFVNGAVVDFEPQVGTARIGLALSAKDMLARFYNNVGAQYLADGNQPAAYAYFRAAAQADPAFAPPLTTLAWMYRQKGYVGEAESLLVHAASLSSNTRGAFRALVNLLTEQGRTGEAAAYGRMVEEQQKQDPYYWVGVGLDHFKRADYAAAVDALERAQSLTSGFVEVHRYLAMAYLNRGQVSKARSQLAILEALNGDDPVLHAMSRKLRTPP